MVGMTGLGNGLINALLTATGYDASASVQNGGVQSMLALCYLGAEIICYAVIVILMCFLKVEKHIEEDQKTILQHQKKSGVRSRRSVDRTSRKTSHGTGRGGAHGRRGENRRTQSIL